MKFLLDVNVLVAWGWEDHSAYDRAGSWIAEIIKIRSGMFLTSAIPQMGFVRVSVQRSGGQVIPAEAGDRLKNMINTLGSKHQFLPDDQTSLIWPEWCRSASRTTDAHLLALAEAHGAKLATLDSAIPGAFVIP